MDAVCMCALRTCACRYIAVLSSQMTVKTINFSIQGLGDLYNKPVGIFEADLEPMQGLGLSLLTPLPWNDAKVMLMPTMCCWRYTGVAGTYIRTTEFFGPNKGRALSSATYTCSCGRRCRICCERCTRGCSPVACAHVLCVQSS